jgi:2'-5' RNA ligase
VRVFAPSDLHVTLAFIGSADEEDARRAWDLVEGFASLRAITGSFERVKPLGHPRRPSALCAMVDGGSEAFAEMINEARGPLLEAADAPPDNRLPLPHMTLARIQRRARGAERRQAVRWAEGLDVRDASFTAASVALFTWATDRAERLFQIVERQDLSS